MVVVIYSSFEEVVSTTKTSEFQINLVTQIPDDELETLCLEKGNRCPQKLASESLYNSETTPLTSLQRTSRKFYILDKTSLCTPNLQNSIAKFNDIKANLMTIKLLFYE